MTLHRVRQQFADNIEHAMKAAEQLPAQIADAGDRLVGKLLEGGRILVSGDGSGALWANHCANLLLQGSGRERPPLPALALRDRTAAERANALRALGQAGDTLILVLPEAATLDALVHAARDRDVTVLVLAESSSLLPALQDHREQAILLSADRPSRCHEMALLVLHALCDHIEQQLFGELS